MDAIAEVQAGRKIVDGLVGRYRASVTASRGKGSCWRGRGRGRGREVAAILCPPLQMQSGRMANGPFVCCGAAGRGGRVGVLLWVRAGGVVLTVLG